MGSRTCDVWAIRKSRIGRMKELIRYKHIKHVCVRTREFGQEHEGDHRCSCGETFPKLKVRRITT